IERAGNLGDLQKYRLIELLNPEVTHYEFFLTRPPLTKHDWTDDNSLLAATPELNPCIDGFPSKCIFNYDYQIIKLSDAEFEFMQKCNGDAKIANIIKQTELDLNGVRKLIKQQ
ncbi:MAG: SAM-dependent methyltransferase, partial [Sphaerospermopsis kisseleviana]